MIAFAVCICTHMNRNILRSYCQGNSLTLPFLIFGDYLVPGSYHLAAGSLVINRDIILATRYFFCQTNQNYQTVWESAQFNSIARIHFSIPEYAFTGVNYIH